MSSSQMQSLGSAQFGANGSYSTKSLLAIGVAIGAFKKVSPPECVVLTEPSTLKGLEQFHIVPASEAPSIFSIRPYNRAGEEHRPVVSVAEMITKCALGLRNHESTESPLKVCGFYY